MTLRLAKDCFDVGLSTADPEMLDFMTEIVGLDRPEVLRISRTVTQHRFDVGGSVVKVNIGPHTGSGRTGYRHVAIADEDVESPELLVGPDGVTVSLVPPGHDGIEQLGVTLVTPHVASSAAFFREALGWDRVTDDRFRVGRSVVTLVEDADAPFVAAEHPMGWSYLTVQVHDCDAETAVATGAGARLALAPVTLGTTARISMVDDPFGNRVEISQRASLVGPLPAS